MLLNNIDYWTLSRNPRLDISNYIGSSINYILKKCSPEEQHSSDFYPNILYAFVQQLPLCPHNHSLLNLVLTHKLINVKQETISLCRYGKYTWNYNMIGCILFAQFTIIWINILVRLCFMDGFWVVLKWPWKWVINM